MKQLPMKMLPAVLLLALLTGCGLVKHHHSGSHGGKHNGLPPYVALAANLGIKYDRDLLNLYDSLVTEGVRCGMRGASTNEEQIVVSPEDFDRAKAAATAIVVKDALSVRLYKSADFGKTPDASLLEVWEKGKKVREEEYKLHLD